MRAHVYRLGDRVYVRRLDVFGRIIGTNANGEVRVKCEPPMPTYEWIGSPDDLRPAVDVET